MKQRTDEQHSKHTELCPEGLFFWLCCDIVINFAFSSFNGENEKLKRSMHNNLLVLDFKGITLPSEYHLTLNQF